MKQMLIGLVALVAMGAVAQDDQASQSGTPATLEAHNGKRARVFLQRFQAGNLTFQLYKSARNHTIPVSAVKSLEFYPKYDTEALEQEVAAADYPGVISLIGPMMQTHWEYMSIDNNLRDMFCMLMDAYLKNGELSKARKAADILLATDDPVLKQRAQISIALVAIDENDLETAKKIREEVTSVAAGFYLQACIERAENRYKDALKTLSNVIIDHANDVEWLAHSELLCAYIYLDMLETSSVITTNSPLNAARQVKNIYSGTSVAADAEKLWNSLGGADREAAIAAEKAEREAEEKAKRENRKAEKKAKQEAEAAAETEAAVSTNDVDETVETESEKENGGR